MGLGAGIVERDFEGRSELVRWAARQNCSFALLVKRSICGIVKTVVSLPDKLFAVRPLQKHGVQWIAPAQDTAAVL